MIIEDWFDKYQFNVDYDIGESGVKFYKFGELGLNLENIDLRYTQHLGNPELRAEIATQYKGLNWDNVGVTTGAAEAIFSIIASLVSKKDHIIIELPNYPSFRYISESLEKEFNLFKLKFEEKFKPNLVTLESMIKSNTKLICLTHPNNPTGSIISKEDLMQIINQAEERNILILMDETYRDLTFGEMLPTGASLSDNVISVSTMSKIYGVPGIRIGWLATKNETIIQGVLNVREQTTICNSALNEAIALELLKRREGYLSELRPKIRNQYKIVEDWMINQEFLEMVPPEGGVVCFPRLKSRKSSEQLCRILVEKYRTFTVPGYVFKMNEYLRIGFGGNSEELKLGLDKLKSAIEDFKNLA